MPQSALSAKISPPRGKAAASLKLWLQLVKASNTIESFSGSHMRSKYGQSLARFDVLSQLHRFDDPWITTGHLARNMMTSRTNITALLDRMEDEGTIERRPSPSDRRSYQIRMTQDGERLFQIMADDHANWIGYCLSGVSEGDMKTLTDLLLRVRHAFDAEAGKVR